MRRRWLAGIVLLALAGCRTPATLWRPLPTEDARPALRMAGLRELAGARRGLRATARVAAEGPEGAGSSEQLLLVERPARLRIEVVGLLQQRVLVLATDGASYQVYRAETAGLEEGEVHERLLEEVAGLPLTPEAAVRLLLAAPLAPDDPPAEAREDASGSLSLRWPDQTLDFDAEGRLAELLFHPEGHAVMRARWSEWRELSGAAFPYRLELELLDLASRWKLEYREVELNPALDPALFRLRLPSR